MSEFDATQAFYGRAQTSRALGLGAVMSEAEYETYKLQCWVDSIRFRHCLPRPYKLPLERPPLDIPGSRT